MKKKWTVSLCVALGVVMLAGCGNTAEQTASEQPAVNEMSQETANSKTAENQETESVSAETENTSAGETVDNESGAAEGTVEAEQEETEDMATDSKVLIAYFSRTGENYSVGTIEKGNTAIIAEMIAEQTGGELFEIRTVEAYPDDYDECTDVAQQEKQDNARPELAENLESIEAYDVVYLGYPNWWGDMPMAVYTFLESHDFTGKTIIPFCTHAGSGLSGTESSIADICPEAEVLKGVAITGTTAQNDQDAAREEVTRWLEELGMTE